jgi:mycofactocin precursor
LLYVLVGGHHGVPHEAHAFTGAARAAPRGTTLQLREEVLDMSDKAVDPGATSPATDPQQDDFLIAEIEVEELAIDGICGVY